MSFCLPDKMYFDILLHSINWNNQDNFYSTLSEEYLIMYLSYFLIFQCGFCVHGYFLASQISKNSSTTSITMTDLLTECNGFNSEFVIIIGDMNYNPKKLFPNIGPTSLILMNDKMTEKSIPQDQIVSSVQPNLFVINAETEKHLNQTINHLKSSSWWNIKAFYIILTPITTKNCHEALNYLWIMWKMDLINVTFICHNVDEQISMFTYNPYTNRAPNAWETINNPQIHPPWTLLTRPYEKDSSICSSLIFDKTLKLDGYSGIHAAAFQSPQMTTLNIDDDHVTIMLFSTLNLTRNYTANPDRGYVDGAGIAYGMIKNLANESYDIILNSRYPAYAEGIKMSSVIAQSGLKIVSQPRGNLSIIQKIIDYFPIWFFITIIILCATTALVLKYSLVNFSFCHGMTQSIAFLFAGAYLTIPKASSSRIFLFVIFFFILIIQSLFRGRILGFLTIPISKRNMDTYDDLIEFKDYEIYCDLGMRKFVPDELKDRCLNVSAPIGMKLLLTETKSCFISDKYIIIRFMHMYDSYWLHLSPKHVIKEYGIFMMRNNWPLGDRISQGVSRMFESGLSKLVYERVYGEDIRKIDTEQNLKLNTRFKAIRLKDLQFSFHLWGIGVVICLVTFMVEMRWKVMKWFKSFCK